MTKVRIETAVPDDAAQLLTLVTELSRESDTLRVDPRLPKLTPRTEARQIKLINQTRGNVIILAKLKARPIGIVTVQNHGRSQGELGVAVRKPFWRRGLGTALVKEAVNWFLTYSNLVLLMLTVERRNLSAYHIYRRCGFKDCGRLLTKASGPVIKMQMRRFH